ncbi:transporter [Thermotomaculum hydrothermale]|uniref:Transporter n=1 Tax=Thermotomaculum hydrothermale TaxID=981385 RepID=A0A7R6T012_9BACT|nr:SLC13 family permease [Thermotomaculum hydrothermale]BBB33272.1 transporter [Thermotomaculum hydrothermale]
MRLFKDFVAKEILFIIFLIAGIVLLILSPQSIKTLPQLVDWETIAILSGFLFITKGIEESGYLEKLVLYFSGKVNTEKMVALTFILLTGFLSMFLTNDIALFIVIPFTIIFFKTIENNLTKLIVLEALAANAGSALTPIGNPQNIFLWKQWDISFFQFIFKLFPLFIVLISILIVFALVMFRKNSIIQNDKNLKKPVDSALFKWSLVLFPLFIVAIETDNTYFFLPFIVVFYLLFFRKIIKKIDYIFIVLFILVFIDMNLLSQLKIVKVFITHFDFLKGFNIYFFSAFLSQITSNVPATILISKFSGNYRAIAYGVNVGGSGLFLASFANIIALRLAKKKGLFFEFHKISILYFLVTLLITSFLFF